MKRFLTLLFTTLLLTAALCVTASASDFDAVAEDLSAIGMFRGTASGFELDRAPTRSEAAIMLVRLYGAEEKAKTAYEAGEIKHPFTDVSEFTSPYVAWLYTNGITNGTSATTFGSTSKCSAQNYVVFLLRALGYKDGIDFQYADAKDFAVTKGLMDPSFYTGEFLRDDLAAVTYQALACGLADGSTYLLDSLVKSGAIDKTAAKPMTDKITTYRSMVSSTVGAMQDSIDAGFTMKMNMDMDMSVQGETTSTKTTSTTIAFASPLKTKTVMTMTIPSNGKDTKINVISYTKQKGNKLLQYTSTDNKTYEKSTLDLSDYSDMLSSVQTTDMYSDLKIVKNSVTVNGKSTVQIQAQLKGEDIAGLLAQLGLNGDNTQGTSSDYSSLSPITISLWIDKKTYYPVKQTIDMKDFMNEYLSSLVADSDMSYSKIKTSVTYKNFNKATKFSLPKACK